MSQHIDAIAKQSGLEALNSKIGNVRNTDLQSQVTSLNRNLSYSDNDDDINVTIAANSVGVLVNRAISSAIPTGTTIKAITDVYCPGVAGYVCPAIGDNGSNLIIRGLNINTASVTVTKVKYRIWYK